MGIEIGFAIGTVVLLLALAYGMRQYARRDPADETRTEAATRHLYKTTER